MNKTELLKETEKDIIESIIKEENIKKINSMSISYLKDLLSKAFYQGRRLITWGEDFQKGYEQGEKDAIKKAIEEIERRFSETNEIDKAEWEELKTNLQEMK